MTEHLTMNTVAHAAMRRTIARFNAALESFPPGSQPRADQLKHAWDYFEEELHTHHGFEEDYFSQALQQTDADLSAAADLDREHDAMRAALAKASGAMSTLQSTPTETNLDQVRTNVAQFAQVLLDHLAHEERDLEPISAAYQDSAPMKAALKQVKKAHTKGMGNTIEWLQDGADASDRAGLRNEIPAPVVFLLAKLGGRRYRRDIAPTWASG